MKAGSDRGEGHQRGRMLPPMSLTDWTALGAIGALALAFVTVLALAATVWLAVTERRSDDRKRKDDRDRDDRLRAEQQARDDRLRRETADEMERRERAEHTAREDYEARQVVVTIETKAPSPKLDLHGDFNCRITVSTPHAYPIKQLEGRLAYPSNGGLAILPFGRAGDKLWVTDHRTYYGFWAKIPAQEPNAAPIIRFVDWHGNRYYQYEHYTERFPQSADWAEAGRKLDEWIRTGPKPRSTGQFR